MKFEEALYEFRNRLIEEYGNYDPIIKIGISYDIYPSILQGLDHRGINIYDLNELAIQGIKIVPRKKDDF